MRPGIGWVFGLMIACQSGLDDARYPTGSSTMATTADYSRVFTVNTLEGTVSMLTTQSGQTEEMYVGIQPTRIARLSKDRVAVTLRGERAVVILDVSGKVPTVEARVQVGAEPYGIVASENGRRVYVAVSQAGLVLELAGSDLAELRAWDVANEPRWLALHPSGQTLYVASGYEGRLTMIDLLGDDTETLDTPTIDRETFDDGWSDLTPRLTGDPSIGKAGDVLVVPSFYVDNTTGPENGSLGEGSQGGGQYASAELGISRTNPVLLAWMLDRKTGRPTNTPPTPILIADQLDNSDRHGNVRSYPSSATIAPDGHQVLVTMEGSDAIVAVDLRPFAGQSNAPERPSDGMVSERFDTGARGLAPFTSGPEGGTFDRPMTSVGVLKGPTGVAFTNEKQAMIHHAIGRQVGELRFREISQGLDRVRQNQNHFMEGSAVGSTWNVAMNILPPDVAKGRELFYSASGVVSGEGSGISCATCHFDGRNDGLTWTFDIGVRQTPSLAGNVSSTSPVTWTLEVDGPATEAATTSLERMGGQGLTQRQADQIAAFIDYTAEVDTPNKGLENATVALGREVFNREEVGCAECHVPPLYTDNRGHDLYGLKGVNTPTLIGVAATAPYLHDGSSPTLRSLMERVRSGSMGDTSSLTAEEMDALVAFLRTL